MLIYLLSLCTLIIFYRLDGVAIVRDTVLSRYDKWKSVNQLVSTHEKSKFRIIFFSIKLILEALYLSLIQYLNSSVKKLDRKTYEISYQIEGRTYKMIVIPKRGPPPVLQIINDHDIDITDYVLPYMGAQYDWHGTKLTPRFFGSQTLTFNFIDGSEKTFHEPSIKLYDSGTLL